MFEPSVSDPWSLLSLYQGACRANKPRGPVSIWVFVVFFPIVDFVEITTLEASIFPQPGLAAGLPEELPPKKPSESHVCNVCGMTFSTQETLKRHQESIHRQSAGNLRKHHTRKHPNKKYESPSAYTCYNCHKSFYYEANYGEHLKTHQSKAPTAPASTKPVHDSYDNSWACLADLVASLPEECWQCYMENWC